MARTHHALVRQSHIADLDLATFALHVDLDFSGATGMGRNKSNVMRATCMGSRIGMRSMAQAISEAGAPPCCMPGSQVRRSRAGRGRLNLRLGRRNSQRHLSERGGSRRVGRKNDSSANSTEVTSMGVPKTVMVLMKLSAAHGRGRSHRHGESVGDFAAITWAECTGAGEAVNSSNKAVMHRVGGYLDLPAQAREYALAIARDSRSVAPSHRDQLAKYIHRRRQQFRFDVGQHRRDGAIGREANQCPVDCDGGIELVTFEHQFRWHPRGLQWPVVQLRSVNMRREPRRMSEYCVHAAASEQLGELHQHLAAGARAAVSRKLRCLEEISASTAKSSWLGRRRWRHSRSRSPMGRRAVRSWDETTAQPSGRLHYLPDIDWVPAWEAMLARRKHYEAARASYIQPSTFLRRVLVLDAISCAGLGLLSVAFGNGLSGVLSLPVELLQQASCVLLPLHWYWRF